MTAIYFYIITILVPTVAGMSPYNKTLSNVFVVIITSSILYISFSLDSGPDYGELEKICANSKELIGMGRIIFDPGFLYLCDHFSYDTIIIFTNLSFCIGLTYLLLNNPGAYLLLPTYSLFFILWNIGNYTRSALAAAIVMVAIKIFKPKLQNILLLIAPLFHKSFLIYLLLQPRFRIMFICLAPLLIYFIFPRLVIYHDGSVEKSAGYFLVLGSLLFPVFVSLTIHKKFVQALALLLLAVITVFLGAFYSALIGRLAMVLFPLLTLNNLTFKAGSNRQVISLTFGIFYSILYYIWLQYSDFSRFFFN